MAAQAVVKYFYVLEDRSTSLSSRLEILMVDQLGFDRSIKALHYRVVPTVAFAAHAARHVVLLQQVLVVIAGVLAAAIALGAASPAADGDCPRPSEASRLPDAD